MKLKSIVLTTCMAVATLLTVAPLSAQTAPGVSPAPGAPPKFGPENQKGGPRGGGHAGKHHPEERIAHLKEALSLTSDQETKLRDLFKTEGEKMRATRQANKGADVKPEDRRAKMRAARQEMESSIRAILTPEQQAKFDAMRKEHKNHGPKDGKDAGVPKP